MTASPFSTTLTDVTRRPAPAVDGVILVAPAVWGRRAKHPALATALRALAHTMPWLPASAQEFRWRASDNEAMLFALDQDPLVLQWVRIDALHGLVSLMDEALDAARALEAPALILYGAHERIMPQRARHALLGRLDPSHQRRVYPEGYHTLLRDRQGSVVLEDIAQWIRIATSPSRS